MPRPGIEPAPPALEAWSLNHWTTREVPLVLLFKNCSGYSRFFLFSYTFQNQVVNSSKKKKKAAVILIVIVLNIGSIWGEINLSNIESSNPFTWMNGDTHIYVCVFMLIYIHHYCMSSIIWILNSAQQFYLFLCTGLTHPLLSLSPQTDCFECHCK